MSEALSEKEISSGVVVEIIAIHIHCTRFPDGVYAGHVTGLCGSLGLTG
jgi:hypothetical protein